MSTPTLDAILSTVRDRARERERSIGKTELEARAGDVVRRSFHGSLEASTPSVIAEIKRASPSAGEIRPGLDVPDLAREYESAGARALSILTCPAHFQGSPADLSAAREACSLPTLAKDFMVQPFQLLEAAAAGADAAASAAARSMDSPPPRCTVRRSTPRAPADRTAEATVFGMSWSFRSRKTRFPRIRSSSTEVDQ